MRAVEGYGCLLLLECHLLACQRHSWVRKFHDRLQIFFFFLLTEYEQNLLDAPSYCQCRWTLSPPPLVPLASLNASTLLNLVITAPLVYWYPRVSYDTLACAFCFSLLESFGFTMASVPAFLIFSVLVVGRGRSGSLM